MTWKNRIYKAENQQFIAIYNAFVLGYLDMIRNGYQL